LVVLLGGAVYGVYWLLSSQVQQTEAARRTAEDSARAETQRLRQEIAAARAAAAPAAQVESLRTQLRAAETRTAELRAALDRAQAALSTQLAAGEARRVAAQADLARMREALAARQSRAPPPVTPTCSPPPRSAPSPSSRAAATRGPTSRQSTGAGPGRDRASPRRSSVIRQAPGSPGSAHPWFVRRCPLASSRGRPRTSSSSTA